MTTNRPQTAPSNPQNSPRLPYRSYGAGLLSAQVQDVSTLPDRGHIVRRVHLVLALDQTGEGVVYRHRTAAGKLVPRSDHFLVAQLYDLEGYTSELAVYPAQEDGQRLTALPLVSLTGTRDLGQVLENHLGVQPSWLPELGQALPEPTRELRAKNRLV